MEVPTATGRTLEGYAARFNSPSRVLAEKGRIFRESIRPGAFRSVLAAAEPVFALWNHGTDGRPPLGKTPATLQVWEDEHGLRFKVELPESAADILEAVQRGDVAGMSFGFGREKDQWSYRDGMPFREILEVGRLPEISVTPTPAYPQTSVHLRSVVTVPDLPDPMASARRRLELAERF